METKKTKQEHLQNWKLSGLSQAAYCRANGLKPSTFRNWKRLEKSLPIKWMPFEIKEEVKETENIFSFQIGADWKFSIEMRLRF